MRVQVVPVADPDDPALQRFREVRDPVLVRQRGLFVAEGRRTVERLLALLPGRVESLLLTEAARRALDDRLAALPGHVTVHLVASPAALARVAGMRFHQGCLALARLPRALSWPDLLPPGEGTPSLIVGLDGVTDPDNVGSIVRSAVAFGATGLLLAAGSAHPLYRKALRTALGLALELPFAFATDWHAALAGLAAAGHRLLALAPGGEARDLGTLRDTPPGQGVLLLVGAEGAGLSATSLALAHVRVRIEIGDRVDSLNAAVAAALALHALGRGRRAGGATGPEAPGR